MNVLRNVMVQHRTDGSPPFPHATFTASDDEAIRFARLTFPPSIWNIEGNIFDSILDPVEEPTLPAPTETETVSYQTSLF